MSETDRFVEVCVRLEGEVETSVIADLFIIEGTANGEPCLYLHFHMDVCVSIMHACMYGGGIKWS